MLAAAGHQDLGRLVGQAVVGLKFLDNGLFELGDAAHRGIAGEALFDGPDGGFPDVVRSLEVRLPHPEVDYVDPLGLELVGLGVQGQRGGGRNLTDTAGDLHSYSFN